MPETRCVRIKLKPGSLDKVREWAAELNRRSEEVLQTLRDEEVWIESVFLDSSEEGDYLIYYMKVESMAKAREVNQKSWHPIDAYHNRFKAETWGSSRILEELIDFDRYREMKGEPGN